MRESEWTPSLVTERDIKERNRRIVRHDWVALTLVPAGMIAVLIFLPWLAIAILPSPIAGPISIGLFIGMVIAMFVLAGRVDTRRAELVESSKAPERAIRDEFGGGTGWLVELIVHRGDSPLGADRGMLWVEDGRLLYSGHRTSFALSRGMTDLLRSELALAGVRHEVYLTLRYPSAPMAVSFRPSGESGTTVAVLFDAVHDWRATAGPRPEGEYPPTVRGPGSPARALLAVRFAFTAAYWIALLALLVWVGTLPTTLWIGLAGLMVGLNWFGTWKLGPLWRAWRELGRRDG